MAKTGETFAVADRVEHGEYGPGTITGADPRYTTIMFDGVGVKKFVTGLVRLTHTDAPAPVKPKGRSRAKAVKAA